jgi:prevent-host-death family protein
MRIDTQEPIMAARERKYSTVSATEVQRHFRAVLRRLQEEGGPLVIERDGVPAAALVPLDELEQLMTGQDKTARLKRFDEFTASFRQAVEESGLTEDEVLESMKETRREIYEKHYGKP